MEFYEQGKLLFEKGRETKSSFLGTTLDFYIASADAFIRACELLAKDNPRVSERAGQLAYHLYRHCSIYATKDSDVHQKAVKQLKIFTF